MRNKFEKTTINGFVCCIVLFLFGSCSIKDKYKCKEFDIKTIEFDVKKAQNELTYINQYNDSLVFYLKKHSVALVPCEGAYCDCESVAEVSYVNKDSSCILSLNASNYDGEDALICFKVGDFLIILDSANVIEGKYGEFGAIYSEDNKGLNRRILNIKANGKGVISFGDNKGNVWQKSN